MFKTLKSVAKSHAQLKNFKFKTSGIVQFHEVDSLKVVHNLQYQYWTENARVAYCQHLDIGIMQITSTDVDFSVFLVHSEVDYFQPAHFLDEYFVYTRVKKIGNSSIEFEHIVTNAAEQILFAQKIIEVYVDKNNQAISVPTDIRKKIANFEHF